MIRMAATIFAVTCVAAVFAEAFGLGILWYRGQLTPERLNEMKVVLTGEDADYSDAATEAEAGSVAMEHIIARRSLAVLQFAGLHSELKLFKEVIETQKSALESERQRFETQKQEFEDRLAALREKTAADATDQTRGVLTAMPPADAVDNLLQLELEQNVVLLRGMPEKHIARILQEFAKRPASEAQRGLQIFEAISNGDPDHSLAVETAKQLAAGAGNAERQ